MRRGTWVARRSAASTATTDWAARAARSPPPPRRSREDSRDATLCRRLLIAAFAAASQAQTPAPASAPPPPAASHRVRRRLEPADVGRRSARASSRRTASAVQLAYTPNSAFLITGAARRQLDIALGDDRQPRRLPGRAGRGEDRRQPGPVRVHGRRRRLPVGRRRAPASRRSPSSRARRCRSTR